MARGETDSVVGGLMWILPWRGKSKLVGIRWTAACGVAWKLPALVLSHASGVCKSPLSVSRHIQCTFFPRPPSTCTFPTPHLNASQSSTQLLLQPQPPGKIVPASVDTTSCTGTTALFAIDLLSRARLRYPSLSCSGASISPPSLVASSAPRFRQASPSPR